MGDMKINGHGTMAGGEYGRVVVNGSGRCDGLLAAERVQVSGTFQCPGVTKSGRLSASGSFRCDGDLRSDDLNVSGRLKCGGRLEAGRVKCSGSMDVEGDVSVEELNVSGVLRVLGGTKLEANQISSSGAIKIDGQISADEVKITGLVTAREIVGDRVVIHSGRFSLTPLLHIFGMALSKVDLIEATTVELEGVTAQTVNGQCVKIGPNCVIENVDCSGSLFVDPTSTVRNVTGQCIQVDG